MLCEDLGVIQHDIDDSASEVLEISEVMIRMMGLDLVEEATLMRNCIW